MPIYPAAPPQISGDVLSINRFLQDPTAVQRRVREVSLNRFITDVLFPGRIEASGGAILYEISDSIYTTKAPTAIGAGGQYPRAQETNGAAAIAAVTKWGQDIPLTDEQIKRMRGTGLDRTLRKVSNTVIKHVDTIGLAAASTAITQNKKEVAAWDQATADPFLDVMLADAKIEALGEGFETDTLVMTDVLYARMVSNQKVINGLQREKANNVTESGDVLVIAGKRLLRTNRLPGGVDRLLIDSTQFGALGYEDLESPEYEGDPANGIQTWARRDPDANDQWLVRGRRSAVPIVLEPLAGVEISSANDS